MITATIQRKSARWDIFGMFARTICDVSDGSSYHCTWSGTVMTASGAVVVGRHSGWRKYLYDFGEGEAPLVHRFRLFTPDEWSSGDWTGTLERVRGSGERYGSDRFCYWCDRESEQVSFTIPDPAWKRRTIVMGFAVFDRCFPRDD